jgi:hypothetical protein
VTRQENIFRSERREVSPRVLTREHESRPQQPSPAAGVLRLQRALGNRHVTKLIRDGRLQRKRRIGEPGDALEREADEIADTVRRHGRKRMALSSASRWHGARPKKKMGRPNPSTRRTAGREKRRKHSRQ